MAGLEVQGLEKELAGNPVVRDVSFSVPDGEFFVLLGPSGGGKTTILRLICGLEAPDAGSILIDGRDVTHLPPRERNIGIVFQEYGLYPNMDVYHNIAYGLEVRGVPRAEVKERVTEAAELLDLTPMLKHSVVDLSGGEQQRVALARALAKDASVYLYDEPLSNLDPKLRHRSRRHIVEIHQRKQKPSLYVTHDQAEALAMADRIAVTAKGRLQQVGTPEELLDHPANMFVAGFIGSPPMNLIRATLTVEEGELRVVSEGLRLTVPPEWKALLERYLRSSIVVGIRPDGMRLSQDGTNLSADVIEVEEQIGETAVSFRLAGREGFIGLFADGAEGLAPGETVQLRVDPERIELFDPETELSLRGGVGS